MVSLTPYFFILGIPLFVGVSLLLIRWAEIKISKCKAMILSSLVYGALFTIFLTGFGPFLDQKKIRDYKMTWEIKPSELKGIKESEVVLSFVDFPGNVVGEYSDVLAAYLREKNQRVVDVVFLVTYDYGKVRGFSVVEIEGLREWKSVWGYSGLRGDVKGSPWE